MTGVKLTGEKRSALVLREDWTKGCSVVGVRKNTGKEHWFTTVRDFEIPTRTTQVDNGRQASDQAGQGLCSMCIVSLDRNKTVFHEVHIDFRVTESHDRRYI